MPVRLPLVLIAFLLITIEALILSFIVDIGKSHTSSFFWFIPYMGRVLKWAIVFCICVYLLVIYRRQSIRLISNHRLSITPLIFHITAYLLLLGLTAIAFPLVPETHLLIPVLWLFLLVTVASSWAHCFFTFPAVLSFIATNTLLLIVAAVISAASVYTYYQAQALWEPLSYITLQGAGWVLSWLYADVFIDVPDKLLGLGEFIVFIAPECSGLEGILVAILVNSTYLFIDRRNLSFPLAFVLIPSGIALAILFNIARIVLLMMLGDSISPELAINGFHSVAGWLMAVCVVTINIFIFSTFVQSRRQSWDRPIANNSSDEEAINASELASAILIPFILVLVFVLLGGIVEGGRGVVYPVQVIIVGIVLLYYRKAYQPLYTLTGWMPLVVGSLIAIIWWGLGSLEQIKSEFWLIDQNLYSSMAVYAWLVIRLIGFCVITPIVEELFFRAYLMARVANQDISLTDTLKTNWLAIVLSSVCFAILHQAYIAGFITALLLVWVRHYSNNLSAAIIAHAWANLLLSLLAFG